MRCCVPSPILAVDMAAVALLWLVVSEKTISNCHAREKFLMKKIQKKGASFSKERRKFKAKRIQFVEERMSEGESTGLRTKSRSKSARLVSCSRFPFAATKCSMRAPVGSLWEAQ